MSTKPIDTTTKYTPIDTTTKYTPVDQGNRPPSPRSQSRTRINLLVGMVALATIALIAAFSEKNSSSIAQSRSLRNCEPLPSEVSKFVTPFCKEALFNIKSSDGNETLFSDPTGLGFTVPCMRDRPICNTVISNEKQYEETLAALMPSPEVPLVFCAPVDLPKFNSSAMDWLKVNSPDALENERNTNTSTICMDFVFHKKI